MLWLFLASTLAHECNTVIYMGEDEQPDRVVILNVNICEGKRCNFPDAVVKPYGCDDNDDGLQFYMGLDGRRGDD